MKAPAWSVKAPGDIKCFMAWSKPNTVGSESIPNPSVIAHFIVS